MTTTDHHGEWERDATLAVSDADQLEPVPAGDELPRVSYEEFLTEVLDVDMPPMVRVAASLSAAFAGAAETTHEFTPTMKFTLTMSDTDTDTSIPDDGLRVPDCPECGERDAVQLATGEWVCQASGCDDPLFTAE